MPELSCAVTENGTETEAVIPLLGITEYELGQIITGGELSIILIEMSQVLLFPALSTALQVVMVVVDTENNLLEESGQESDMIPDPSLAETLERKATDTSGRPSEACVMYEYPEGQTMVGLM
jgi:hypothetical protein